MFNALNRFISRLDGDAPPTTKENHGGFGFQVLRNTNPQLPLAPGFVFVVRINGRMIVCPMPRADCRAWWLTSWLRTTRTRGYSHKKSATAPAALLFWVCGAQRANEPGHCTSPYQPRSTRLPSA